MPPKKKIVKKTVRKAKPKAQTQSPPPPLSPEPQPEPVPESSPPEVAATETPVPAAEETVATEPTSIETLEPQSDAATATETLEKEPETAAASETLAEEPAAMEATGSEVPAEELAAAETLEADAAAAAEKTSETGKKLKTVTRVRKVVKRRIVKKIVPKTAAAAAREESKVVQEVQKIEEEVATDLDSNDEQPEIESPKADEDPAPMETVPETTAVDTEIVDTEKAVAAEKAEDVPKEEEKGDDLEMEEPGEKEAGISERIGRKKTEIFIGGLDRDAKEEDLRKVFGEVGEIVEVRMIMDGQSGKNKGYAFLRYADASQAKKAAVQFEKVEVCGKLCGASALKGNDTIFLGNTDKKWKKEDIIKLLHEAGIDKIEDVSVHRGFAFLDLETNKDAQNAWKKLQKKDAFGKGQNIKVAWAEPLNDPDEEEVKKVKSVYVQGIPAYWTAAKVRESFKKFGEIERIMLARNIKSSKRKDFAFVNYKTRESAVSCIESFDKEELTDNGSKLNVKVSLAKRMQKRKQNKGGSKLSNKDSFKEKPKVHRDTKASISLSKGKSSGGGYLNSGHMRSSTNHELLHVLREQATWKQGQVGYARGPPLHDYTQHGVEGKRPFSSLGDEALYSDMRGYPRARLDSFPSTGSSYGAMPHGTAGPSHPYYQRQGAGYSAGAHYGDYPAAQQMRQGARPPYGSSDYPRY